MIQRWQWRCAVGVASAGLTAAWLGGAGSTGRALTVQAADPAQLTAGEVRMVVQRAAEAVEGDGMAISVTDRAGRALAVFVKPKATRDQAEESLGLARTAAFFSNDQAPLSSRTVRYISGIHFPPGVRNTPNAALYGIENTNRGCDLNAGSLPDAFPPATTVAGTAPGRGIVTGKADVRDSDAAAVNPGGVPLFRDGKLVGGVGVAGLPRDSAEFAAFSAGAASTALPAFGPRPAPPGVIFIDGIKLPFVKNSVRPAGARPGQFVGTFLRTPIDGRAAPDGYLVRPGFSPELSKDEVERIIANAVATASRTRALIRLPIGQKTRMVIAVGDLQGRVLGLYRMPDSTIFSIDVAVTKARNVVYFSSPARAPEDLPGVPPGTAVTNRTISFGAQPFFPPGIEGTAPGPFFDLFVFDRVHPCTQGRQPPNANQSGIVFFPGSVPLYKGRTLVGGLGISGDGVEQDDYVAAGGGAGFEPPPDLRADHIVLRGVRLPYLKFPRHPED